MLFRMRLLAAAVFLSTVLVAQSSLYEEDLQLSRPYRDENYRQFSRYIDDIERQGSLLRFKKMIG